MNGWFKSTVAGVIIGIGIVLSRDYIFAERGEPDSFFFAISRGASAVVNIFIKSRHVPDDEVYGASEVSSSGSGIIMSSDGLVITNYHVIMQADENSIIGVQLRDGTVFEARLIGYDKRTDIAVLHVNSSYPLPQIIINENRETHLGDVVLAIGNPYNLGQTITHGIISAVGRRGSGITRLNRIDITDGIQDLIQTDAPINSGNSGGALVNTRGEFVGMSTATMSDSKDAKAYGISFAIPASQVLSILSEILKNGRVIRGYLGIAAENIYDDTRDNTINGISRGIIITSIDPNGPARGELKPGDVIVSVNGKKVRDMQNLMDLVADSSAGTKVFFEIIRNGRPASCEVVVSEQNAD